MTANQPQANEFHMTSTFSSTSSQSHPMSENLHRSTKTTQSTPLWSSQSLLNGLLPSRKKNPPLGHGRQCARHRAFSSGFDINPIARSTSHFTPSSYHSPSCRYIVSHQKSERSDAPRLPPPPTPDELVRPPRHSLFSKSFRTNYWKEPEIKRQPLTLPPPTLWQGLWHSVDSETKKVRLLRRRIELYGEKGPSSRQTFESHDVCGKQSTSLDIIEQE